MRIKDFISNEWSAYADYDNRRSLPHIMDGLKITQRKALYAATKLPQNTKPLKVSQFAAKAAEITAYHHGDASMISTVVGLAQDYPGSNNYPLLEKHGQFGTRLSNEAAAPRYIHTKLHANWKRFFHETDQNIVEFLYDDGDQIEPKYFIPVVPTILLNGCDGLGNGFKSSILNYELKDILNALNEIRKSGRVVTPILPRLANWNGSIEKDDRQITFKGVIEKINKTKLRIVELPPIYDNEKYRKFLNKLLDEKIIRDYENHSTEDKWDWHVQCSREIVALPHDELMEKFGLVSKTTENFVCWGMSGAAPMTFDSPEHLIEYWYDERLKLYKKRIHHEIECLKKKIIDLNSKLQFILWCTKNDFRSLTKADFISKVINEVKSVTEEHANKFVNLPIYKITVDEVEKLSNEIDVLLNNLDKLEQCSPLDLMRENIQ